ncbi:MAG TPA: hypothetical protein VGB33_09295 [Acidimicrobiia bacterium]
MAKVVMVAKVVVVACVVDVLTEVEVEDEDVVDESAVSPGLQEARTRRANSRARLIAQTS